MPQGTQSSSFLWQLHSPEDIFTPEDFTEEDRSFSETARQFMEKEVLPNTESLEEKNFTLLKTLFRRAGELGLLMAEVPETYGGLGLPLPVGLRITEELGVLGSFAVTIGAHTGIGTQPLVYFGTEEQKRRYLPRLAGGDLIAAYALTEPTAGSDALSLKTTATKIGDGSGYELTGSKQFITNGGIADLFTVFARTENGVSAFLVERNTPGLTVGPEEKKMGIRGSSTCPLFLDRVKVPRENLLGEEGKGHKIAFNTLNLGRVKLGVGVLGPAKYTLNLSLQYAKERVQFQRPIAHFGLVRNKLAEMAIRIFLAESMAYRTAGLLEDSLKKATTPQEKIQAIEEFSVEASIIKVYSSECLNFVADEGVQIHGGYGFIAEYPVERIFRDSRINRIFEGTNEINRLIIPATILKRAGQGKNPLMTVSQEIGEKLRKGEVPSIFRSPFPDEERAVESARWITLYTTLRVVEKFLPTLADEQEILGEIANLVISVFAMDSVLLRVWKIFTREDPQVKKIGRAFLTAILPPLFSNVVHSARHLLMDIYTGEELEKDLSYINRLRWDWPSKVLQAEREIASFLLERGNYPPYGFFS